MNVVIYREIEITVELAFHKGHKGARDSLCGKSNAGPQLEPDEEPEMEVISATYSDGKPIDLTENEIDDARQQAFEKISDRGDE